MINYYLVLLIMTFVGSVASFYLKKASNNFSLKSLLKNKNIYMGGILYLLSAFLNILLLKHLNYSVVLPLTSITYVWTLFISNRLLNEKITFRKFFGVIMVFAGAIVIVL